MSFETFTNLLGVVGLAVLSVPVWRLNRNRKILQRIKNADRPDITDSTFRKKVVDVARMKSEEEVSAWRPWHEICLWVGYGCLFSSALVRLVCP